MCIYAIAVAIRGLRAYYPTHMPGAVEKPARTFRDTALRSRFSQVVQRVGHLRRQVYDQELRAHGITALQWWVLGRLARHAESGLSQTELARAIENGKVAVGAMITRLEGLGLVERRDHPGDRRVRRIFLTDAGFAAIERLSAVAHRIDAATFGEVDVTRLEQALATLQSLRGNLEGLLRK